jgi:hypothetical protein
MHGLSQADRTGLGCGVWENLACAVVLFSAAWKSVPGMFVHCRNNDPRSKGTKNKGGIMKMPRIVRTTHGKNGVPELPAVGEVVHRSQRSIVHVEIEIVQFGEMTKVSVGYFMTDCDGRNN